MRTLFRKDKRWKNCKATIVFHEDSTGPGHDLRDYLLKHRIKELLFIAHPLLYMKTTYKNSSRYDFYRNGKLVKTEIAYHWVVPEYVLYIKDVLYTIYWSISLGFRSDIFIGLGNLDAFTGLVLKFFGFGKNIIYFVIDYVPLRFQNKLLNMLYHAIDNIAADKSNWTWNLSPRMIEGRNKRWKKEFANQLVVPHGVHASRIKRFPYHRINKHEILYMGVLLKKQGVQILLNALPLIAEKIPDITFTIIGRGPYEGELRKIVKHLKLTNRVCFLGYIESHSEMENRMARASIAIALYDKSVDINDYTYYADPGKIKNYLGAGVPVVMTDVAWISKEVEKAKCGVIVKPDYKSVAKAVSLLLLNSKLMGEYRKNAIKFAKNYEWDHLFTKTFKSMFPNGFNT